MPTSDISVIIPLFNREGLIGETLSSVLGQTCAPAAVIVVDDGSTDGSVEAAARFGSRVTVIRNPHKGVQAARKTGLAAVATPWVALCDSDDLWQPTWLERVMELRRAAPSIDFVFGNFRILRDGVLSAGTKFDDAPAGYWSEYGRRKIAEGWLFDRCLAPGSFTFHPFFQSAMAFSKDAALRAGGFNVALSGLRGEDGEFTLRLLYTAKVGAIREPLVAIRKHPGNYSADQLRSLVDEIWLLTFIKQQHTAALPYHDLIDREIIRRSIAGVDAAFAAREHGLLRQMLTRVPWRARPLKVHLKHAVASLPGSIGTAVNSAIQRISEAR